MQFVTSDIALSLSLYRVGESLIDFGEGSISRHRSYSASNLAPAMAPSQAGASVLGGNHSWGERGSVSSLNDLPSHTYTNVGE